MGRDGPGAAVLKAKLQRGYVEGCMSGGKGSVDRCLVWVHERDSAENKI